MLHSWSRGLPVGHSSEKAKAKMTENIKLRGYPAGQTHERNNWWHANTLYQHNMGLFTLVILNLIILSWFHQLHAIGREQVCPCIYKFNDIMSCVYSIGKVPASVCRLTTCNDLYVLVHASQAGLL